MAGLTRWLPETFDAEALAGVPAGVLVDTLLPAEDPLAAFLDAYAVAVAEGDEEGVRAMNEAWQTAKDEAADADAGPPDWADGLSGDWIDADEAGEPVWPDEPTEEAVTEARKKSSFTGERRDSLGRRRCYVDGKQVKCEPVSDDPEPPAPPDPARPWDRPDWERSQGKGTRPRWVNRDGVVRYGQRPLERPEAEKKREYEDRLRRLAEPAKVSTPQAASLAGLLTDRSATILGGDPQGWASLIGAPNGTVITAGVSERTPRQVNLSLNHPDVDTWSRWVTANEDGTLNTYNAMFFAKAGARGSGLGTRAFSDQVKALFAAGGREITTTAGKGGRGADKMNGYYTWARMGYDSELEDRYRYRLPPALKGARTVQDLMATPEGRQHWKATGYMDSMRFDLTPGSRSIRVLNEYIAGKGLPPVPDADPAVLAAREKAIADRKARLGAAPQPYADDRIRAGHDAVADRWHQRLGRALGDVAIRLQNDPEARLEAFRDPSRTPEERADALWLRHAQAVAAARLDRQAREPDTRLSLADVAKEAERLGVPGGGVTWAEDVWLQAAVRHLDLDYSSRYPHDAAIQALRRVWLEQTRHDYNRLPPILSYGVGVPAARLAQLRQQQGPQPGA
jgi:hypothetical protein